MILWYLRFHTDILCRHHLMATQIQSVFCIRLQSGYRVATTSNTPCHIKCTVTWLFYNQFARMGFKARFTSSFPVYPSYIQRKNHYSYLIISFPFLSQIYNALLSQPQNRRTGDWGNKKFFFPTYFSFQVDNAKQRTLPFGSKSLWGLFTHISFHSSEESKGSQVQQKILSFWSWILRIKEK